MALVAGGFIRGLELLDAVELRRKKLLTPTSMSTWVEISDFDGERRSLSQEISDLDEIALDLRSLWLNSAARTLSKPLIRIIQMSYL